MKQRAYAIVLESVIFKPVSVPIPKSPQTLHVMITMNARFRMFACMMIVAAFPVLERVTKKKSGPGILKGECNCVVVLFVFFCLTRVSLF